MGSPNFESEGLELHVKKDPIIKVIAKISFIHVLGRVVLRMSSLHDIEKMLRGGPPKEIVQEAM
jgi:hypothetical protein